MAPIRSLRVRVLILLLLAGAPFAQARAASFIRGDVNASGSVNITDAIGIFRHLFLGDTAVLRCLAAGDVDGNGRVDVTDGIRLLSYLFLEGDPPSVQSLGVCVADTPGEPLGCELAFVCARKVRKGVFFVGKSDSSMREGTKLQDLRKAMLRAINGLSEEDEFAIIFYNSNVVKFPQSGIPARATRAMRETAFALVTANFTGFGSCEKPALVMALSFARQSTSVEKSVLFISDGFTPCPGRDPVQYGREALALVCALNTDRVPINVIGVGPDGSIDEAWLRTLAAQNDGTFTRVVR